MKKFIIVLSLVVLIKGELVLGQIIFSNGTGGGFWDIPGTWSGGIVPQIGNDVIIQGTDSVFTGSNAQCNNLTISSGTRFATGLDSVVVAGQLTLEAGAYFYNQAEAQNTLPGSSIFLDPASTVVHIGAGSVGGEGNLEFGNLIIQRNAGVTCGGNLIIQGDLSINMDAQNRYVRAADDEHVNQTQTVQGNVYLHKGTLSCVDAGDFPSPDIVGLWNIMGNVYVYGSGPQPPGTGIIPYDARIGPFSSASAMGIGIFNIEGDLIIDGGRLHAGTSSTAGTGTGIINLGGDFTLTVNSNVSTTHAGPFALNFVGNENQTVTFGQRFSMSTNVFDTIKAGSNVVFNLGDSTWRSTTGGDFVVNGSLEITGNSYLSGVGNFTLNSGGTLKLGSSDGISASDATGNIQVTGTRTYSPEANYEYKGTDLQIPGSGLPSSVNGLTVNNPNGLILLGEYTVNNSLNISNGFLFLNTYTVTLGENAVLTETPGNTVRGISGKLTTTRNIGAPSSLNVGGLGAVITSGVDLGNTTVERIHSAATGNGNSGILRQYNIVPANNSGLNATLRLYYDESELNGLSEEGLVFFRSADGTENFWAELGGTANTGENYVELSGISDFSYWTIANTNGTLPVESEIRIPEKFTLSQNYPNPFNPSTKIKYTIPASLNPSKGGTLVTLKVYGILGNEISALVNEEKSPGEYEINFNSDDYGLSSGVYFYKIVSGEFSDTKKMILTK